MTKRITTISAMIEALGGDGEIAQVLGTSSTDVRSWTEKDRIPPGWHLRLRLWGEHAGLNIANSVFGLPENYPASIIAN